MRLFIKVILIFATASCGNLEQTSQVKRAWDYENAPDQIGLIHNGYETQFDSLKKTARLSKKPWSGDYWATYLGGLSYRWSHPKEGGDFRLYYTPKKMDLLTKEDIRYLSPSEKMDLLNYDETYSYTREERERTQVLKRKNGLKIPEWFGLCHAWAPATLLFDNPSPIVVKRSDGLEIPFGSSDVKALLVYFMDRNYSKSYFVSRRCDVDDAKLKKQVEKGEITLDEYTRTMESAHCRGINPGAFHIILGNMIGLKDKGFIADVTRDLEVWNQAVSGYRSKILMTRLDNFSKEADPRTIKEVKIETIMEYTVETPFTWKKDLMNNSTETIKYTYWLELDQNRNIIGGTWISHDRPDFLWNRDRPQFKGAFKFIERVYNKSTNRKGNVKREQIGTIHKEEQEIEISDSKSTIFVNKYKKTKSIFGERVELSGRVNKKTVKLKVEYFTTENKNVRTRFIFPQANKSFLSASFFWWDLVKIDQVKLTAMDVEDKEIAHVIAKIS